MLLRMKVIAAMPMVPFIRYNDKYKSKPTSQLPQGKFSIHLEQQKLPPMGDDLFQKSALVVLMLSSDWQAVQDPENRELDFTIFRDASRYAVYDLWVNVCLIVADKQILRAHSTGAGLPRLVPRECIFSRWDTTKYASLLR